MAVVEPRYDDSVWPILVAAAACLCQELVDSGLPSTCFCGPLPGNIEEVAWDYCGTEGCDNTGCGGMGFVTFGSNVPSSSFPAQDVAANCATDMAATLYMGVLRCAPMMDGRELPTEEAQFESTRLMLADMAAMKRAILCCMKAIRREDPGFRYVLGQYSPEGPQGGCVGGVWEFTVSQWRQKAS